MYIFGSAAVQRVTETSTRCAMPQLARSRPRVRHDTVHPIASRAGPTRGKHYPAEEPRRTARQRTRTKGAPARPSHFFGSAALFPSNWRDFTVWFRTGTSSSVQKDVVV